MIAMLLIKAKCLIGAKGEGPRVKSPVCSLDLVEGPLERAALEMFKSWGAV